MAKNIMRIGNEDEVKGIMCRTMMQNDPYTCQPITTEAGAKTIDRLRKKGAVYNLDGRYTPKITGYIVRARNEK